MVRSRATILVVDDEPLVRRAIVSCLSEYDFLEAGSIADAKSVAEGASEIDLVLLDKNLRDGLGFELIPHLRQTHPNVEIIMITATGPSTITTAWGPPERMRRG